MKESFANLKELGNRSVASLGGSVGDRALFFRHMDSLEKQLLEFLKIPGAKLGQIDLNDIEPTDITEMPVISSDENEQLLRYYIESSQATLARMNIFAEQAKSEAGRVVVAELNRYLQDPYDFFPEAQFGELGLLDDALMIHNVAFRLIESRIVSGDTFSVNWEQIIQAEQIVRMVLPEQAVFQLEGLITQYVGLICAEFAGYHPAAASYGGVDRFLMPLPLENGVGGFF